MFLCLSALNVPPVSDLFRSSYNYFQNVVDFDVAFDNRPTVFYALWIAFVLCLSRFLFPGSTGAIISWPLPQQRNTFYAAPPLFFPPAKGAAYKIVLPLDAVGVRCTYAKTNGATFSTLDVVTRLALYRAFFFT